MATPSPRTCFVCEDGENECSTPFVSCNCGSHHICIDCLRSGAQAMLNDETCYPLSCADNSCPPISTRLVLESLATSPEPNDANLLERLESKVAEYRIPLAERVYCNNESCIRTHGASQLLNPGLHSEGEHFICPYCSSMTCRRCKALLGAPSPPHLCPDSSMDSSLNDFLRSIPEQERWLTRQCPACGIWVTKESACNHMTCRCGGQFCLCCGRRWGEFWYDCQAGCPKYEAPIYDVDGYNQHGYNPNTGRDRDGLSWEDNHPTGDVGGEVAGAVEAEWFDEYGFDGEGYHRDGFDMWGVDRDGRDREGYDEEGLDSHLFYRDGHDRFGIPRSWYPDHDDQGGLTFNIFGYDQEGYKRNGRDIDGFERAGIDVEGYNYCGMDYRGRYRNGLRDNGYTYHHRDLHGNVEPGYRLAPDGNARIDHVCNTCWCHCELEREPSSANICAICRLTLEDGELTHDFERNSGPVHDTCHKLADEDYVMVWMMSDWERAGFLGLAEMIVRLEEGKQEQTVAAEE